jgi:hypothetical protein
LLNFGKISQNFGSHKIDFKKSLKKRFFFPLSSQQSTWQFHTFGIAQEAQHRTGRTKLSKEVKPPRTYLLDRLLRRYLRRLRDGVAAISDWKGR